ncbi:MAG: hypothetical protein ABJP70_04025 [Erythrobacter sp.]
MSAQTDDAAERTARFQTLAAEEGPLNAARVDLYDCETGCMTPSEAAALAFSASENQARKGRFILDIRGGGRSLQGALGDLFFINSHQNYATFGTLTVAFDASVLKALLRRARVCNSDQVTPGKIEVKACRGSDIFDVNMFTMMQRLHKRRIIVEGEVRLQWIDSRSGLRPREGAEAGYYQVWIEVTDADKIFWVYED